MHWRKRLRLPVGGIGLFLGSVIIAIGFSTVNFRTIDWETVTPRLVQPAAIC